MILASDPPRSPQTGARGELLIVNKPGNWRDVAWQEATWQWCAGHGSRGWYDVNGGDTRANVKWCRHWRAVGCTGCLVTTRTTYLVISSARSQSLNNTIHFLHFYTFPWIQNIGPLKWRGHKNCPDHPSWLCHLQTRQQKPQQLINDLYIGVDKSAGHNVITACSVTVPVSSVSGSALSVPSRLVTWDVNTKHQHSRY